jgi:hypothetical protein
MNEYMAGNNHIHGDDMDSIQVDEQEPNLLGLFKGR